MLSREEYRAHGAVDLAKLIAKGEATAGEVAACAERAIAESDPKLNPIAELYEDRIAEGSSILDSGSPLYGVPFLLKDAGAGEKNRIQTNGSRLGENRRLLQDSDLVIAFRNLGLNIIGRTTSPEFTMAATTESALHGATTNPWNRNFSCGGSSGGAAAAVAAGLVPLAHGTDTGGSIRIPASCCGVVGFKPSRGWFKNTEVDEQTIFGGLNEEFVMARSVADAVFVFRSLSRFANAKGAFPSMRRLRIAVATETKSFAAEEHCRAAVNSTAEWLSSEGVEIRKAWPSVDEQQWAEADKVAWAQSIKWLASCFSREAGISTPEDLLEPVTVDALEFAKGLRLDDWFEAMSVFEQTRSAIQSFFDDFDFLITPTLAYPAPRLGELSSNQEISFDEFLERTGAFSPFTPLFNVSGNPAISIPHSVAAPGVPIGMHIIGRRGDDESLLALASILEEQFNFRLASKLGAAEFHGAESWLPKSAHPKLAGLESEGARA